MGIFADGREGVWFREFGCGGGCLNLGCDLIHTIRWPEIFGVYY